MRTVDRMLLLLALAASAPSLYSQATLSIQTNHPEKPIVGLPFTADFQVETKQQLGTGPVLTRQMTGIAYRDGLGLERFDATRVVPDGSAPAPTETWILDHTTHTAILLNSKLRVATVTHLPENSTAIVGFLPLRPVIGSGQDLQISKPVTKNLGRERQDILDLVGTRTTSTIPTGRVGNDQPISIVSDTWVSPKLKLLVRQTVNNPLAGERTVALTNFRFQEPDPALFLIPDGYKVEERPAIDVSQTAATQGPRTPEIQRALKDSHAAVKNEMARSLANSPEHLADAETLAREAVDIVERQSAKVVSHRSSAKAFNQMMELSEYWDTLAAILYREHRIDEAQAYLVAAWQLEPHGFLCVHLGRIYEEQNRPADAIAVYRMALGEGPTQAEKDQLEARLTALGAQDATPLPIDITVPLKTLTPHTVPPGASSVFDIVFGQDLPAEVLPIKKKSAADPQLVAAIRTALDTSLPDSGPEELLYRASLGCTQTACALHLLPSGWARAGLYSAPAMQ